uniref:Ubiquitin-like domain-containing protein n=1 Tax=Cebus imitator TaxID=2715852 RepID=A0A2K5PNF0_CEBIM
MSRGWVRPGRRLAAGNRVERGRTGVSRAEAADALDVFLMIRCHLTTIFAVAKESSTVFELKRIVKGILKRPPDEQQLQMTPLRPCASSRSPARPSCPM